MPERARRLAVPVLVVALLVGTAVAFGVTESLKLERSPVIEARFTPEFTPGCRPCRPRKAVLMFRLRRTNRLDVEVVSDGEAVRTLARNRRFHKGRLRFKWNGRDDAGEMVPAGTYRVRVYIHGDDRTVVFRDEVDVLERAGA
jgi:hypothetical protein